MWCSPEQHKLLPPSVCDYNPDKMVDIPSPDPVSADGSGGHTGNGGGPTLGNLLSVAMSGMTEQESQSFDLLLTQARRVQLQPVMNSFSSDQ